MTTDIDETLEATKTILAKHGIRRTSMSDIADAAGVSRQTLYSRFENKEGILQAVVTYTTLRTIAELELRWQSCSSVAEKLDVYFKHVVVSTYTLLQSMPDAADLYSTEHPMIAVAIEEAEKKYTQSLRATLQPCGDVLKQHGESPASVASFVTTTGYAMKHNATSVVDLNKKLLTLRRMVCLMVGEN